MPEATSPCCTLQAMTPDEDLAGQLVDEMCQGEGRLSVVGGPDEFRDAFRLLHPTIVLLDGSADEEACLNLLRELRVWYPALPVIYVTGSHSLSTELEARRSAVLHYTAKPPAPGAVGRLVASTSRFDR